MGTLSVLVVLKIILSFAVVIEMYSSSVFDNIDIDEILHSERLLKNYINCFLDKGGCTPDAKEIKKIIPDAIETDCSQCSESQKKGAKRIIQHLMTNKEDLWDQLMAKYDPTGQFRKQHIDEWLSD